MNEVLGKLVIEVEDTGMDSGCLYDILQECVNHGRVLSAKIVLVDGHVNDLFDFMLPLPEPKGRC